MFDGRLVVMAMREVSKERQATVRCSITQKGIIFFINKNQLAFATVR